MKRVSLISALIGLVSFSQAYYFWGEANWSKWYIVETSNKERVAVYHLPSEVGVMFGDTGFYSKQGEKGISLKGIINGVDYDVLLLTYTDEKSFEKSLEEAGLRIICSYYNVNHSPFDPKSKDEPPVEM